MAAIEGSREAIITRAPSFTSYEWRVGVALAERGGGGLATFAYLSVVHLAICMHGMLGNALSRNNSSSGVFDGLKRKRYGNTLRLQSIAGMMLVVALREG